MEETDDLRKWLRPGRWLTWFGVWTIPGLISASQLVLSYQLRGDAPDVGAVFRLVMPGWYLWGALSPAVFVLVRRVPLEPGSVAWRVPIHLAANVVLGGTWVVLVVALRNAFDLPGQRAVRPVLVSAIGSSLLVYWTLVLIAHAARLQRDRAARARRETEMAGQLSAARLAALRAQLQPHFLFNTLNAISAYVRSEPDRAERMLAELGDLLREVLEAPDRPIVPLARELEFVDRYLSIQATRLGDRLEVRRDIDDETMPLGVPSMILQPLVENAVEHGIARRRAGGVLRLSARRENGRLRLEVSDDGPGPAAGALDPSTWRVGLGNTRERLRHLFGDACAFEVGPGEDGGVTARVVLPALAAEEPM